IVIPGYSVVPRFGCCLLRMAHAGGPCIVAIVLTSRYQPRECFDRRWQNRVVEKKSAHVGQPIGDLGTVEEHLERFGDPSPGPDDTVEEMLPFGGHVFMLGDEWYTRQSSASFMF